MRWKTKVAAVDSIKFYSEIHSKLISLSLATLILTAIIFFASYFHDEIVHFKPNHIPKPNQVVLVPKPNQEIVLPEHSQD